MSDSTAGTPQFSRRALLGAAAAAGVTLGLARPAFAGTVAVGHPGTAGGEVPFGPVVVAEPAVPGGRISYARAVRLSTSQAGRSRTLLATFQGATDPGFPIYRSDDDGRTWAKQSNVPDASTASGAYRQPFLYELPRAFAGLPQGALLFACNWQGNRTSTNIQLYASTDGGLTWKFLSTVAQGGPPDTTNGATPVWEPFLLLHKDKLICYYSDQRDPKFGQKLAHQTSTDLRTWGPVVDDATGTTYDQRPGMTTVARLRGNLWIMTYEFGTPDDPDNPDQANYSYHVHYRIATDPESFRFSADTPLLDQNGEAPNGAPVVSWSDSGGRNGTIVVTDNDHQDFFVNRDLGSPGAWRRLSSPMPAGYSRFTISLDGPGNPRNRGRVFVITGAQYGKPGGVEAGVISLGG
ncbi:sialidase family protein [Kribbella sp. NPDC051620]|uniref:sialidase family protein n=1 Tax=Kribbella sp. NPDC051620 TaxID=3364120 RepID=UPI0037B2EC17